jgi:spore germination protein
MANRKGEEHGSITPYQLTAIYVGAVVGVGVLAFPRLIVEQAGTAAPLATLLGAVPAVLAWLSAVQLHRWFKGRSLVEYAPKLLTRPLGWLYGGLLVLLMIMLTAMTAREFGEVVRTAVLPNTPIEITIGLMLLSAAYFVRFDVEVFARVFEVFFPVMLVPLTIIGLLSLKNARWYYIQPVLGRSWQGLLSGTLLASVGYVGSVIVKFLLPALNRPKQAVKAGLWGVGLAAFVYQLAVFATLAVFGPEEIRRLIWPTFELIKQTTVRGFILERLESAFVGIWVAAVFTTVSATYYTALLGITQLFRLKDHKVAAIPLVPVFYITAMLPENIHQLYSIIAVVGLGGVVLDLVMPVVLVVVGYLLGKGRASRARSG